MSKRSGKSQLTLSKEVHSLFWMSESHLRVADVNFLSHFSVNKATAYDLGALFATYAFAFELLLKCSVRAEGKTFSRTHDLAKLYGILSPALRRATASRHAKVSSHFVDERLDGNNEQSIWLREQFQMDIEDVVRKSADAFVSYRYSQHTVHLDRPLPGPARINR